MSSTITRNTLARAFSGDVRITNIPLSGARFGGAGGIKDLIFSMLTFGIYAIVKSSAMEQKQAAVKQVMKDIYTQIDLYPDANSFSVQIGDKKMEINKINYIDPPFLQICFDNQIVDVVECGVQEFRRIIAEQLGDDVVMRKEVDYAVSNIVEQANSEDGFVSEAGSTVYFENGMDMISLEEFGEEQGKEWCLLRRVGDSDNLYDLITVDSVESLDDGLHPLTRNAFGDMDVLRGTAMLPHLAKASVSSVLDLRLMKNDAGRCVP
ncbi:hypothetical protein, partial [Paraburkholderia sp. RL17-373-BIF-A]|uniref:hypothetical protein n=1 Tax=Paraburkholderia sp. RL17-373-BIF-A TaxID=3031629 RepID=UPI0038B71868